MLQLDRDLPTSLIDQINEQLGALIRDGGLPPGTRLPSIRKLASTLNVSAATVVAAYDRLCARGLIEARAASGYFVSRRPPPEPTLPLPTPRSELDALALLQRLLQRYDNIVQVGSGFLPESWLEDMLSSRLLAQVARNGKRVYAQPGHPLGYPPLRAQLSLQLGLAGMPVPAEQIMTTIGATHAIDLICRTLLAPGDVVVVEEPAYFATWTQLRAQGIRVLGIPRLATGPDVEALAALCRHERPRMFFTQTLMHNPTSTCTDAATAFRVLELAHQHDFRIVEDDVYGDLHPAANPLRLTQLDRLSHTIFVGGFSKTISPSIRIGFVAASPDVLRLLLEQKLLSILNSSEFDERLVHQLLVSGRYRKHLERVRTRLALNRAGVIRGLTGAGLTPLTDPDSGLFVWAALPPGIDVHALAEDAANNGYFLTPGDLFFIDAPAGPWLRFNAAASNDPRLFAYLGERIAQLQQANQMTQQVGRRQGEPAPSGKTAS